MIRQWALPDTEAVQQLLLADGWGARVRSLSRLQRVIASATRAIVAEEDGKVIGFGRCVTDESSNGYISLVVVAPQYRRRGIGTAIVDALTGDDQEVTWVLRAGKPEAGAFWEALGFKRSDVAYERIRVQ